ncbi:MAG: tRNA pseudouridine(55) synthase TruB [Gemmataceae bacterium]|nr:tRNA pseudouridine(55) synthase TruB [Gemmataceae bacterium]
MNPSHHGLLVLDKPGGMTSREAVDRTLRWFPRGTRIGHTGTLDPLATGVLVLCIGTATRFTEYVQRMAKTYRAGILLGARSDTDDSDGTITPVSVEAPPDPEAVRAALAGFVGSIEQVPPAYSAAKLTGQRAYDLARRGEEVELQPRTVHIYRIDLLDYAWPRLQLEVHCGKGTYIRSLARDLGERLGCGGLIESLRRTRVGPFTAAEAVSLNAEPGQALARLLPVSAAAADLPRLTLSAEQATRLRQGQTVRVPSSTLRAVGSGGDEGAVFGPGGAFVGVARVDAGRGTLAPARILPELPARGR